MQPVDRPPKQLAQTDSKSENREDDSIYILMTAVSEMSISLYNNGIDSIK